MAAVAGLAWMDMSEACDLLRVDEDNASLISAFTEAIPYYVEICTGYAATCVQGVGCDEVVKTLCRFVLQLWWNPDGTDAEQLTRVVNSLTATIKALVIASHEGE